jgi:hypothetical protein
MLLALANALLVLRFLPETRWMGTASPPVASTIPGRGLALAGWRQVQRHPLVARLVAVNLLFIIPFTAMETVFMLFTQHAVICQLSCPLRTLYGTPPLLVIPGLACVK